MYYLAYGSNLSKTQMSQRCPDAEAVGKGMLKNYALVFRTHATIEKSKGSKVPVVIWKISERDEHNLDRYEGFPKYYVKKNLDVTMTNFEGKKPKKITAMAYVMTKGPEKAAPSMSYYGIISEGYRDFEFDEMPLLEAMADCLQRRN